MGLSDIKYFLVMYLFFCCFSFWWYCDVSFSISFVWFMLFFIFLISLFVGFFSYVLVCCFALYLCYCDSCTKSLSVGSSIMFFSANLSAYFFIEIIPLDDDVSMIEFICQTLFSLMLFLMEVLLTMTSKTPILAFWSAVFTSVCDCTQSNTSLSLSATLHWISGEKNDMYLLMVSAADCVCSVENTTCPDSANISTASAVSLSRISPTKIISGSSRSDPLSALANDRVSCQTSLCEIRHLSGVNINSMGSSMVIMFSVLC